MRLRLSTLAAATVPLLAAAVLASDPAAPPRAHRAPPGETERIQTHLLEVEADLRAADVSHLDAPRRAARARVLDRLAEYRERGLFPHNHTHPGERVPVFVDGHGTACAVGHLLLSSGEEGLVRTVVEMDNNVRVPALAGSERLRAWLHANGLTLEEAARIQPAYGNPPPTSAEGSLAYEHTTMALSVASAGAVAWGLLSGREGSGPWPGVVALGAGLFDGAAALKGRHDSEPGWAVGLNAVGAVVSGVVGLRRLLGGAGEEGGAVAERPLVVVPTASEGGVGITGRWRP